MIVGLVRATDQVVGQQRRVLGARHLRRVQPTVDVDERPALARQRGRLRLAQSAGWASRWAISRNRSRFARLAGDEISAKYMGRPWVASGSTSFTRAGGRQLAGNSRRLLVGGQLVVGAGLKTEGRRGRGDRGRCASGPAGTNSSSKSVSVAGMRMIGLVQYIHGPPEVARNPCGANFPPGRTSNGTMLEDLKSAIRLLRGSPAYTAVALIVLALGIGAGTAIFSVVDAVVLRALPFDEYNRIVAVLEDHPGRTTFGGGGSTTTQTYLDWRDQQQSFDALALVGGTTMRTRTEGGDPGRGARLACHLRVLPGVLAGLARDRPRLHAGRPGRGQSGGHPELRVLAAAFRRRARRPGPDDRAQRGAVGDRRRHAARLRLPCGERPAE